MSISKGKIYSGVKVVDSNFKKQLEKAGTKAAQSRARDAALAAALQGPCSAPGPLSASRKHYPPGSQPAPGVAASRAWSHRPAGGT